ncbi:MAG: helix-turn-helix domain-containing protein [Colwellia sp.]|jgi:transcriptional regulator with XRE-family HTH domain|nr:helix-turn-helix domain-containing protein [Colwellia sp.]
MLVKQTLGRVVKSTNMPDLTKSFSPEQLAKAITAKRTGMKLTLVNVSAALSLSKPTLIKIEKGDTSVKLVNILKVMEYLGLSFSIVSDELTPNSNTTGVSDEEWY